MKNYVLVFSLLFLLACEKEYFPDPNAYRDETLVGTWVSLQFLNSSYLTVLVFTQQGYCGRTSSYINAQSNYKIAFQDIDGIWYVEQTNNENNLQYNRIHSQKRFRNGIWKHTEEYYFQGDTLFLRNISYKEWDTLIKYKYQLIYDGPKYIGLDSIN